MKYVIWFYDTEFECYEILNKIDSHYHVKPVFNEHIDTSSVIGILKAFSLATKIISFIPFHAEYFESIEELQEKYPELFI